MNKSNMIKAVLAVVVLLVAVFIILKYNTTMFDAPTALRAGENKTVEKPSGTPAQAQPQEKVDMRKPSGD